MHPVPALVALPSGQPEASFPLVRIAPREVVFENPGHDFPQRITYRLEGDGALRARIEGPRGGAETAIDFPMRQVPCGAGPTAAPTAPAAPRPRG